MKLSELKEKLLGNNKVILPIIFINEDNDYLIKTYINLLAKNTFLTIKEVESIQEMIDIESSMFKDCDYLYIYRDKKEDVYDIQSLMDYKLVIITDDKSKDFGSIDTVVFKKLEPWQIESYIAALVPGLTSQEIEWLCKNAGYDINRLDNEASKLSIFDRKEQPNIFKQINDENGYCDLNELTIFNLSNAIIKKDIVQIKRVIKDIENIDIDAVGLTTILMKNFLNILNIQTNSRATADSLGMSEKQFRYLQYNQCNKYSNEKLIKIYDFLTGLDYKLKNGLLDMSNNELTYYIVSKIME